MASTMAQLPLCQTDPPIGGGDDSTLDCRSLLSLIASVAEMSLRSEWRTPPRHRQAEGCEVGSTGRVEGTRPPWESESVMLRFVLYSIPQHLVLIHRNHLFANSLIPLRSELIIALDLHLSCTLPSLTRHSLPHSFSAAKMLRYGSLHPMAMICLYSWNTSVCTLPIF